MPTADEYCNSPDVAGGFFENQILYKMCFGHPGHDSVYVTAGKITAIGRIYAAAPERGAGNAIGEQPLSLSHLIACRFKEENLDGQLRRIPFNCRFSPEIAQIVVEMHAFASRIISDAIAAWNGELDKKFSRESFASKYLHFHRPNAFPIMDYYSNKGVRRSIRSRDCPRLMNQNGNVRYARFCDLVLCYVGLQGVNQDWTPRSIDTELMRIGKQPR